MDYFNVSFQAISILIISSVIAIIGFLLKNSFEDMKKALIQLTEKMNELEKKNIGMKELVQYLENNIKELRRETERNRSSIDKIVITMTACDTCRMAIDRKSLIE